MRETENDWLVSQTGNLLDANNDLFFKPTKLNIEDLAYNIITNQSPDSVTITTDFFE